MIIVTSISPKHSNANQQQLAIDSWNKLGYDCYSLNCKREISFLEKEYNGVTFIETDKTMESIYGKPVVNINAFFEFAKGRMDDLLLINSDIHLRSLPEFKMDGITIMSRYDYEEGFDNSKIFSAGWDVFHIPFNFLSVFPPSMYALGVAFHDYSSPYRCILKNIPVYWPQQKHAFHKIHKTQYDYEEWFRVGEMFKWEHKIDPRTTIPQIATHYLNIIKSTAIKV